MNDMDSNELLENKEIVAFIENQAGWKFPAGKAKDLMSARLTLDPLFATQRPFFFYSTIGSLNFACHVVLRMIGFTRRSDLDSQGQTIYYRPARKSAMSGQHAKPIVFIHGIGIGFTHYLGLISSFPTEVDVYLVEWPHVAMQMASRAPTIDTCVQALINALDTDGHSQACFVAHSLGTTAVAWMLHHPEGDDTYRNSSIICNFTLIQFSSIIFFCRHDANFVYSIIRSSNLPFVRPYSSYEFRLQGLYSYFLSFHCIPLESFIFFNFLLSNYFFKI